jgi:hypothetical protein
MTKKPVERFGMRSILVLGVRAIRPLSIPGISVFSSFEVSAYSCSRRSLQFEFWNRWIGITFLIKLNIIQRCFIIKLGR